MNLDLKSYQEWNDLDYIIIKGSKAKSFKDGLAYFSKDQVKYNYYKDKQSDFNNEDDSWKEGTSYYGPSVCDRCGTAHYMACDHG